MTSQDTLEIIRQSTPEWVANLRDRGWFRVGLDTPQGRKRLTFLVTEEGGERELMVAAEGAGCLFVDFSLNRINWFLFVQGGFDLVLSHAATDILTAVLIEISNNTSADTSADTSEHQPLLLSKEPDHEKDCSC